VSSRPNQPVDQCTLCEKPDYRGTGFCRGHYARKERGASLEGDLRQYADPARTFMEAAFAFADAADGDDGPYERAWKNLCMAGRRFLFRNKVGKRAQSRRHVRKADPPAAPR
jgi:hypothetical protein